MKNHIEKYAIYLWEKSQMYSTGGKFSVRTQAFREKKYIYKK